MMWSRLSEQVQAAPDRLAVIRQEGEISYWALASLVETTSTVLPSPSGPRPWRVVLRHADPFTLLVQVLACWRRGFSAVVLRDSMPTSQVEEIIRWLKPVASFDGQDLPAGAGLSAPPPITHGPRDEALVICTSGTTGIPKLVALPAESVSLNAAAIASSLGLGPDDRLAIHTPLGYMYGLMGGCMASLWAGATCRLFRPRDPLTQLQAAIFKEGITVVQGPPSLFRLFMGYWNGEPFPSVRVVTTGGEALDPSLADDMGKAFPNARRLFLYGMTEAGPRISHLSFEEGGGQDACIGVPYPHFEWRLDRVEQNPHRRLIIRGPSMFLGYIDPDGKYSGLDADGYFRTRDLFSMDAHGILHFRGRLDRIFRSGGRLVNPSEIERLIVLYPGVIDAVCRPEAHEFLGLVPVVEVVARNGEALNVGDIQTYCSTVMEAHILPRKITVVRDREVAESGKQRIQS